MRRILPLLAALLAGGCGEGPEPGSTEAPFADRAVFDLSVAPVLEARCANPTCHGGPWRPLALYAPRLHRMDPADLHRPGPLNEAERSANFERARAFLEEVYEPEECPLVSKPLAVDAGGASHGGGAQFEDAGERDYQAIRSWVRTCLMGAP